MCVFTGLFTPGLTSPWYSPFDKTIVDRKSSENHADADPSLHRLHDGRENEDTSSQEQVDCREDQVHSGMEFVNNETFSSESNSRITNN